MLFSGLPENMFFTVRFLNFYFLNLAYDMENSQS